MILSAHAIRIELPRGWSGFVFARPGQLATVHAADFPLAIEERSSFGATSTATMPAPAAFLALAEYQPGDGLEPGSGLFAVRDLPLPLDPAVFSASRVAHPRPGQVGSQHFFTVSGRPLCLYTVLAGPLTERRAQVAKLNHVLATLTIAPRA